MALIWRLTAISGSAAVLSAASAAAFLPNALLGITAGALVDRMNRKTAMIAADLFIAAVSLVLVFASAGGGPSTGLILAVLAVRSIGTAFHTPAISAAAPLIVPQDSLTKCAGYTQSLQTIGYIAGTAAAGILYPVWSISAMVALDVIGALAASLAAAAIKIPDPENKSRAHVKANIFREMKDGYNALKNEKGLFALLWTAAVFMILYSPVNALFPLMSLGHFRGTTVHASIAEIAFSLGMLGGGMIIGAFGGFKKSGFGIALSIAMMGIPIFISGLLPPGGFAAFAVCCAVMGLSVPFYNAPVTALMQKKIAPEYLGRVFGLYGSVASLAMPAGLALSGLFADALGTARWFSLTGVLCTLLAAASYLIRPIRCID